MLMRFLRSLEIPIVAELRDSQNYVYAAARGIGICEMPAYRVARDMERLDGLIDWLDSWRLRRFDAMVADVCGPSRDTEIIDAELSNSTA